VEAQRQLGIPDGLSMDTPLDGPISGLASLAADRSGWRDMQKDIPTTNVNRQKPTKPSSRKGKPPRCKK